MRIIPRNTKVATEFFRGVSLTDMLVGTFGVVLVFFTVVSSLPHRMVVGGVIAFIFVLLLVRIDEESNYMFLFRILKHLSYKRHYKKLSEEELAALESARQAKKEKKAKPSKEKKVKTPKEKKVNRKNKKARGAEEEHEQESEESLAAEE